MSDIHASPASRSEPAGEEKRDDHSAAQASSHGAPGWAWWSLLFNVFLLAAVIYSLGAVFDHPDLPNAPTTTALRASAPAPPEVAQQSAVQYSVTSRGCSFSERWNRNMYGGAALWAERTSGSKIAADSVAVVCALAVPEDQVGKTSITMRVSYNGDSVVRDTSYTLIYADGDLTHVVRDLRPGKYEAVVLDRGRRVDGTYLRFEVAN